MILTVTLNPALDRTMTVPNFQAGFRNRATDTITLPGGKGINVARAAKALGPPRIASVSVVMASVAVGMVFPFRFLCPHVTARKIPRRGCGGNVWITDQVSESPRPAHGTP